MIWKKKMNYQLHFYSILPSNLQKSNFNNNKHTNNLEKSLILLLLSLI